MALASPRSVRGLVPCVRPARLRPRLTRSGLCLAAGRWLPLLPTEVGPILMLPSITTVTFYEGEPPVQLLRSMTQDLVEANPWLSGQLRRERVSGMVGLSVEPEEAHFVQTRREGLHPKTPLMKMRSMLQDVIVPAGIRCVDKQEPLFLVAVVTLAVGFALVVSMSHVLGDGFTFYRLYGALDQRPADVGGKQYVAGEGPARARLNPARNFDFPAAMTQALGVRKASWPASRAARLGSLLDAALRPRHRWRAWRVDGEWLAQRKRDSAAAASKFGVDFVSSNDVLTSWFLTQGRFDYGIMAVNFRDRLCGLNRTNAGNYKGAVGFWPEEFVNPAHIRHALLNPPYFRGQRPDVPGLLRSLRGRVGVATNWASNCKELHLQNCKQLLHLPVLAGDVQVNGAMIIFQPKPGELGLLLGERTLFPREPEGPTDMIRAASEADSSVPSVAVISQGPGEESQEKGETEDDIATVHDPVFAQMMNMALEETLDPGIRKAVSLLVCLERFGVHWQGLDTSSTEDKAEIVSEIDDFISHDWATRGLVKYLTLCALYNGRAAVIAAVVAAVFGGVLQIFLESSRFLPGFYVLVGRVRYDVESAGCLGVLLGMSTYLFMLFFWQRLRHLVMSPRMVFMDRLCISQSNPEKKKKGIMGLAGFLKLSGRLVVLWSPRYFTRLWCVYEIATWMHLKKPLSQIIIAPVAQGSFGSLVLCGVWLVTVLMTLAATIESWELYALILGFAITCIMAGPLHVVRHLVRDLRQMPIQIKNFTFLESQCFCCSENHLSDGRPIPCDRDIISDKLEAWFGPSSSGVIRQDMAKELYVALSKSNTRMTAGESAQDLFNRYVQEVFGHYLLRKVGGSQVKYSLAMAATLPACFYICDRFHLLSTLPVGPGLRLTFFYASVVFAFFPVLVRSSSGIAHLADYLFGIRERKLLDFLVTLVALLALAATTFSWLFVMDYTLFHEEVAYQVLAEIATVSLTVFLYRTELVCCHKRKRLSRLARRSTAKRFPSRQPSDPIEDSRVLAKLSKCSSWQQSTLSERPPQIRLGGKTLPDLSNVLPNTVAD
ncbi:unnamed protein product [Effrenium voratum]|uniref:Uncharacterized protein n=1 Tax=Effrenium voratum TaxID=2562239 RepID=A0AA36IQH0_9DINO|nr:unnamed protein product [Effrenium voratum]